MYGDPGSPNNTGAFSPSLSLGCEGSGRKTKRGSNRISTRSGSSRTSSIKAKVVGTASGFRQAHEAYVVASVGVARVFGVPNEFPLAAGAQHLVFVALDRHEVLADEPAPLAGPGYRVAEERPAQGQENLLLRRTGAVGPLSPMRRRLADLGVVYRIARDQAPRPRARPI